MNKFKCIISNCGIHKDESMKYLTPYKTLKKTSVRKLKDCDLFESKQSKKNMVSNITTVNIKKKINRIEKYRKIKNRN